MTDCPFNRLTSAPIPNEVSQIGAVGIVVSDERADLYIIVGCPVDVGRLPMPLCEVRGCFRGPSSIMASTWPSLELFPSVEDS